MQLAGKRIIVTGGASGCGAAAVRAFAAEGAEVVSLDVQDELGKSVAADASRAAHGQVLYYHCDVSVRTDVQSAFDSAADKMGGLDALVHVAAVSWTSSGQVSFGPDPQDISDAAWDRQLNVNAKGTMLTNQLAFKHMHDHGGRILNFGSGAGLVGRPYAAHYSASKGAVHAWTRAVAQAWGKYGITVNAIAPTMVTPMYQANRALLTAEQKAEIDGLRARTIPLWRGAFGDPDQDLAPVLVFLVSDGARFITGQTICVDGGMIAVR